MEWYEEQNHNSFGNKEALLAYCMDDVNVLRQTCCASRNFVFILVKMNPFPQTIVHLQYGPLGRIHLKLTIYVIALSGQNVQRSWRFSWNSNDPSNCRSSRVTLPAIYNIDFALAEPIYFYADIIKPNLDGDSYVRLLTSLHFQSDTGYHRFH